MTNAGTDKLNWSATADQPWLKLSKATGHAPDQIEIDADVSNLALGTHTATITFINDSTGGSVQVPVSLCITKPNPLQVSPASLSFTTTKGTNPSPQPLSVANAETDPLHWSTTADQSWLKLSKATGSAPDQVTIGADISTLKPGTHTATITFINDSTGGSVLVPVSLSISEPNPLQVSPASLSLTTTKETSPSTLALSVANAAGKAPLEWDAAANQSWLKLSKDKGSTPDDKVEINADASALAPGTYTGTITFSSTRGNVLVPVTLRVGTFPWLIIIQDIAIIGEQLQKQDKENKSKTSKDQKPAKISGPEVR